MRSRGSSGSSGEEGHPRKKRKLSSDDEKDKAREKAKNKIKERRKSARLAEKYDPKKRPILTLAAAYNCPKTQKLNEEQSLGFEQSATLKMTTNAPGNVKDYYEFRQYVRDSFDFESGESQALGVLEWDDPYGPDYGNDQITDGKSEIVFFDEPGFSTDRKVGVGDWLTSYVVCFQWTVTNKVTGEVWTSPEKRHSLTSPYKGGANGKITVRVGSGSWQVTFPSDEDDSD